MQHKFIAWFFAIAFSIPTISYAVWQVANPLYGTKNHSLTTPDTGKTDHPTLYMNNKTYLAQLKKGLLKDNVEEMVTKNGWALLWYAPDDYRVLVKAKVAGPTFQVVMDRLLERYNLRAIYDTERATVAIVTQKQYKNLQTRGKL